MNTSVGLEETFGSTCHGAGRAMSRHKARAKITYEGVLNALDERGIRYVDSSHDVYDPSFKNT